MKTVDHVAEEVLRDSREKTVEMEEDGGFAAGWARWVVMSCQGWGDC